MDARDLLRGRTRQPSRGNDAWSMEGVAEVLLQVQRSLWPCCSEICPGVLWVSDMVAWHDAQADVTSMMGIMDLSPAFCLRVCLTFDVRGCKREEPASLPSGNLSEELGKIRAGRASVVSCSCSVPSLGSP